MGPMGRMGRMVQHRKMAEPKTRRDQAQVIGKQYFIIQMSRLSCKLFVFSALQYLSNQIKVNQTVEI